MSKGHYWSSSDDFRKDLDIMSEFFDNTYHRPKSELQPSEFNRRARSKATISIYDDEEEEIASNSYQNGRGYPAGRNGSPNRPGGSPSFLELQNETTRDIRSLCRLDFSNAVIENSLKSKPTTTSQSECPMPNIRLTSSSTSSSSRSSPVLVSKEQSPQKYNSLPKMDGKAAQRAVYAPTAIANRESNAPMGIFDMLKSKNPVSVPSSSLKVDLSVKTSSSKSTADIPKKLFVPAKEKGFDINSHNEFPRLK